MENNTIPISIIVKTKNSAKNIYILTIIYYTKLWKIEKTNKDIKKLSNSFKKLLPNFLFFQTNNYLENEIETFFKECNKRIDIIFNDIYKLFLNLDKNTMDNYYVSEKLNTLGPFNLCINNFCYSKKKKIIIICGFNEDELKVYYHLDVYFSNIILGEVYIYLINIDDDNKFNFKRRFEGNFSFKERVTAINLTEETNYCQIAFEGGSIKLYELIYSKKSKKLFYLKQITILTKFHSIITGIRVDEKKNIMF